jgi:hypothetical protein
MLTLTWHRSSGLAVAAAVVALVTAPVPAAQALAPKRLVLPALPGQKAYACVGAPLQLFNNSNTGGVSNGGTPPEFSTKGHSYCLSSLTTYHWDNGQGAPPGTIGLETVARLAANVATIGPFPASGSSGQGTRANVNWSASMTTPVVLQGSYSCIDSDPATWSENQASGGHGFCTVMARTAVPVAAPRPAKPVYTCSGAQVTLFNNTNTGGVLNGGKRQSWSTYSQKPGVTAYCLNSVETYHWDNGKGATPGKLGLGPLDFAALLHPVPYRRASGSTGQAGAKDVNCYVDYPTSPNPVIISGTYDCEDSDSATWSSNPLSKGFGFCTVAGTPAYISSWAVPGVPRLPVTPPKPGTTVQTTRSVKCFTGTLSSMLLYPIHLAPSSAGMVLLQCGISVQNGFRGRLTPSGVFAIEFGCTAFWTYPPQSPGVVPYLQYTGAPNSACLTAKDPLPWSVHGPWRIDYQTTDTRTGAGLRPGGYAVYVESGSGDSSAENNLTVT